MVGWAVSDVELVEVGVLVLEASHPAEALLFQVVEGSGQREAGLSQDRTVQAVAEGEVVDGGDLRTVESIVVAVQAVVCVERDTD